MPVAERRDELPFELLSPLVRAEILGKELGFQRPINEAVTDIVATSGNSRGVILSDLKFQEIRLTRPGQSGDKKEREEGLLKIHYNIALREAALERKELKS
jgi:hypothetical protein